MNIFKKLALFAAILSSTFMIFSVTPTVHAALFDAATEEACKGASQGGNGECTSGAPITTLENRIKRILTILSTVVGIAAIISIILNGLRFITSNGDANSISSAKHGVIYALVGLIVVALAQVIVRFVLSKA